MRYAKSVNATPAWIANVPLMVALVAVMVGMSLLSNHFLSVGNLLNATRFMAEIGLIALGMTAVVVTGGIDLSVGALLALIAVVLGLLVQAGLPAWIAIALVLPLGAALGLLNGTLITRLGLPPIIITLATLAIFRGVAYGISEARALPIPDSIAVLGQGYLGVVPVQLMILAVVAALVWLLLARSGFGRTLYAIGAGETAARFAGLRVQRAKLLAYGLSGLLCAVAAVIFAARVSSAKANAGTGYELDAITIVVLGGTPISGGRGGVAGTLLGLVIVGLAHNGMALAYIPAEVQSILIGVLLVTAVAGNTLVRRYTQARSRKRVTAER